MRVIIIETSHGEPGAGNVPAFTRGRLTNHLLLRIVMNNLGDYESHADPATLNEFVNSLQRIFKIGIYYPTGHAILDKATRRFMRQLAALAGNNPSVTIQDRGNTLALEGVEVDPKLPFVQEFKTLLSTLGLVSITIDREISMPELHEFVRKMLSYKAQVVRAKKFTQVAVSELPHSITVTLKEFLARQDASISEDRSGEATENLESFINSLSEYGLTSEEIGQCKEILDSLPSRLSESSIDMSELPHASWDDVARLLAKAVKPNKEDRSDLKSNVETQSNINALASILKKLENETQDQKSRESINLLVSIIKKPLDQIAENLDEETIGARVFPDKPSSSVNSIQEYVSKNRLHPKVLANIPESPVYNEMLSILMQFAQYEQTLQSQLRMQQLIREILSSELTDTIWKILSRGLHMIIRQGNPGRLSSILKLLTEPLRRPPRTSSLKLFFLTAQLCNQKDKERFWPYVVNEILVCGCGDDQKMFAGLCQFAASVGPEKMDEKLPQLQELESFDSNIIAPNIFHGVTPPSYPLFAFLLKTEVDRFVGDRVVGGLRRNPPEWLSKAIAPLLDLSIQEHKLFLYSYLRQATQKVLPQSLKNIAAKIIAEKLSELPQERRSEVWVESTIAAMAYLKSSETQALLTQIASEKKLLFIPEWPAECRKAADSALTLMKKRR